MIKDPQNTAVKTAVKTEHAAEEAMTAEAMTETGTTAGALAETATASVPTGEMAREISKKSPHSTLSPEECNFEIQVFEGEWDEEGVYFYQAFNDNIADWALLHQRFGGPAFNPTRMTWIKPSFAWMLYRAGYGYKHNQNRILKVKMSHAAVADLLSKCECKHGGGGTDGRVQWDPARDLMQADGKEPRKMLRRRAIQIGFRGKLSEQYVNSVISIQDVTQLSHKVGQAHAEKGKLSEDAMAALLPELPVERPYLPACSPSDLVRLGMMRGETAAAHMKIGRGMAIDVPRGEQK